MDRVQGERPEAYSHRRRTAAILVGDGTSAAYLAGALRTLAQAGARIDLVAGRGAGALVAALESVDQRERFDGPDGLLAKLGARKPWRLRPFYRMTAACLLLAFAAFASPLVFGLLALVLLPAAVLARLLSAGPAEDRIVAVLSELFALGEPFYLRAMVLPLVVLCGFWSFWWVSAAIRERRLPTLPEPFDLAPLRAIVSAGLWQAARGASSDDRPKDDPTLSEAYRSLLSGSLGQRGFKELIYYALDTDGGGELCFALLKDRHYKKLAEARRSRPARAKEPVDLTRSEGSLLVEGLLAALSPPGLVPPVGIQLPLGLAHGGEVHRFSSSVLAGSSATTDAVAAGAEQVIVIAGCGRSERPRGSSWERLLSAALARHVEEELLAARRAEVPVFLIQPDELRLRPFQITGRPQRGGPPLGLEALAAHGRRDAYKLFVEPVLGREPELGDVGPVVVPRSERSAGPREL